MACSALALTISLYGAHRAGQLREEALARREAAARALQEARSLHADAMGFLSASSPAEPVALALARTAHAIQALAAPAGVTLSEIGIQGQAGAFDAARVDEAARPLAVAPSVKRSSIALKGNYSRLDGLVEYLRRVARGQAALAAFKADAERFEATVHVFGS